MARVSWQRADLVPLAQRLRYLHVFRILAVAAILLWARLTPEPQLTTVTPVELALLAGYLAVVLGVGVLVERSRRPSRWLFGATLLLDGLVFVAAIHAHGGLGSPLRYLPLLHVILVTLVGSHRTGLKLTIWHSLLLLLLQESIQVGLLESPTAPVAGWQLGVTLAVMWLAGLVTASASAVNEREILRRRFDLDALASMAAELEGTSDLHGVAGILAVHVAETFDAPRTAVVSLRDGEPLALAGRGLEPASSTGTVSGVLAAVVERRTTLLVARLGPEDGWLAEQLPDGRHLALVPLVTEGTVHDVLVVEAGRRAGARIEQRVVRTMERFASQGALALRNARLHAELVALAQTDGLTGAANRPALDRALAAEVSRVHRHGGALSLLLIDIDHFKRVNDEHGHQVGDEALTWVASVLEASSREYDLVARYGGEEFAVVMPSTDPEAAHLVADRIRRAVAEGRGPVPLTVSVGVAGGQGRITSTTLIQAADEALYAAKHAGRNRVERRAVATDDRDRKGPS